jgi:hypothetical protein
VVGQVPKRDEGRHRLLDVVGGRNLGPMPFTIFESKIMVNV